MSDPFLSFLIKCLIFGVIIYIGYAILSGSIDWVSELIFGPKTVSSSEEW